MIRLWCTQILAIVFGIIAAIRLSNWVLALYGIGAAILLAVLQYTAKRFFSAGDTLSKASPSKLAPPAFLDSLAPLLGEDEIRSAGVDPGLRAEQLDIAQFDALASRAG